MIVIATSSFSYYDWKVDKLFKNCHKRYSARNALMFMEMMKKVEQR